MLVEARSTDNLAEARNAKFSAMSLSLTERFRTPLRVQMFHRVAQIEALTMEVNSAEGSIEA